MGQKKLRHLKNIVVFQVFWVNQNFPPKIFFSFIKVMSENEDLYMHLLKKGSVLDSLVEELRKILGDFKIHIALKFAFQPHLVGVSKAPKELKMELINRDDPHENFKKR